MINLELTLEEINIIMAALGNAPYVQVYSIIAKLKEQAAPQVSPPLPARE